MCTLDRLEREQELEVVLQISNALSESDSTDAGELFLSESLSISAVFRSLDKSLVPDRDIVVCCAELLGFSASTLGANIQTHMLTDCV